MTTLTLVLPLVRPTPGTEFDYVVSRERGVVLNHGTATAALLPRADQLVLVVPAAALSWHPVRLPPVPASRRRAALDGLLEERLLDDPAQLALALAPARLANGDALVAAFDKAWIRAHLEFFEQSGRPAARVEPEFSPGADGAAGAVWHVTGTPQDAHLVVVQPQGLLHLPLHSALSVIGSRPDVSGGDKVLAEPAVAELAEQVLGFAALVQPVVQRVCDAGASEWDLAQFDLSLSAICRQLVARTVLARRALGPGGAAAGPFGGAQRMGLETRCGAARATAAGQVKPDPDISRDPYGGGCTAADAAPTGAFATQQRRTGCRRHGGDARCNGSQPADGQPSQVNRLCAGPAHAAWPGLARAGVGQIA